MQKNNNVLLFNYFKVIYRVSPNVSEDIFKLNFLGSQISCALNLAGITDFIITLKVMSAKEH